MSSSAIAPTDVRDYAKSLGWSLVPEAVADRLFVLTHPEMSPRQIVIPIETSAPDYVEAVQRAMEKLAFLHHLSVEQVVRAVQTVREDTLRYRITTAHREDDTLPLPFAAALVQGAQQMLLASACTVMKPQIHHPRLHRTEAQQLVENARFGQTEQGSFVLRVSCPIDALDVQGSLPWPGDDTPLPFVRMATMTVKRALHALVDAVETDTLDHLVERAKQDEAPLLSSNFCEAVTRLYDHDIRNAVEISFAWAVGAALPQADRRRDIIRIQGDYFARIEEVRRELRATERHQDDTFIGTVERLDGEMGTDGRRSGEVIVSLLLREGESVRARLTLSPDHYAEADRVHMIDGAYVKVTGRLHPGRQPRLFSDIRHFEAIMPPSW